MTPGSGALSLSLSGRDSLPELTMLYHRPPDRVSRILTRVIYADSDRMVWLNELHPSRPFVVEGREVIGAGYWGVWFLWNGRPYDIGKFYDPRVRHTGYYVDVLEPVRWAGDDEASLEPLTDLFLDLWITPGGRWHVLDEPEFEEAETKGWIDAGQAQHGRATLAALQSELEIGRLLPSEVRGFELRP